jgi:cytochrome c-type biogenesis protein CcmH
MNLNPWNVDRGRTPVTPLADGGRLAMLLLGFLLLAFGALGVFGEEPQGVPLQGEELTRRTQEVSAALRCPVCQGLSVGDSPSEMAVNMKNEVRAMLARGYTREQIEAHFVRSYGEFVLLQPKNPVVWILPIVALAIGVLVVVIKLRSLSNHPPIEPRPRTQPDDPDLARVRQLVKGATS